MTPSQPNTIISNCIRCVRTKSREVETVSHVIQLLGGVTVDLVVADGGGAQVHEDRYDSDAHDGNPGHTQDERNKDELKQPETHLVTAIQQQLTTQF